MDMNEEQSLEERAVELSGMNDHDAITKMVTSKHPGEAAAGRLAATEFYNPIDRWFEAELERGTAGSDIFTALAVFHASMMGRYGVSVGVKPEALTALNEAVFEKTIMKSAKMAEVIYAKREGKEQDNDNV